MAERFTLSLDAMGGDHAPRMVIKGLDLALKHLKGVDFLLFGDERRLAPMLENFPRVAASVQVRHTEDVVDNETKASVALRSGRNSSMRLAINAVADGEAAGVVSAGNTGALMAMAKFVMKTVPGVDRPAIATFFPTLRGETVVLDLGANIDCDADNLVQFAVMGEVFARKVLGVEKPSIGLLNVGVEGFKGNDAVRMASAILRQSKLPIHFHGFVEGDDISAGTVDVVVTDGFTGNIALKSHEGMARLFTRNLRASLKSSTLARIGGIFMMPALRNFRDRIDPRRYNGAMFLGLNGICVKSHGGTDPIGFSNAIQNAVGLVSGGFNELIKEDLAKLISDQTFSSSANS